MTFVCAYILSAAAASEHFNCDNANAELRYLALGIITVERPAEIVQVNFNNNFEDQG